MKKITWSFCVLAMVLFVGSLPAVAQSSSGFPQPIFFSDLGSGSNVYNCCDGWTVAGSGTIGSYFTAANEFMAGASGTVTQIDIGIGYVLGTNSFFASLYTANGNEPGTVIQQWNGLSSNTLFGSCCGLVSITNIVGVNLTEGTNYFLVIGPTNLTATTWEAWNFNSQGVSGLDLYATSGCQNGSGNDCEWNSNPGQTLGAFDVLGGYCCGTIPEPSSLLLLGTGLAAVFGSIRWKLMR
jgi:hypothetical protein